MCFSVFGSTVIQVAALGAADKLFTVKSDTVKDGKITFTVSLSGGVEGFGGTVILIEYDNTVLAPAEEGFKPASTSSGVQQFSGEYVSGEYVSENTAGNGTFYSVGYTNASPVKVKTNTEFFKITFDIINEERPTTYVNFYCKEFFSTTDSEQSITVADGLQTIAKISDVATLEAPKPESATLLTNAIVFKWKGVVGATEYEIRRKTLLGTWEKIARVTADNSEYIDYNLESGNTYVYTVQPLNDYTDENVLIFNSTGVSCKYISKPTNITAESGIGGIDIAWDKTNGVDKYQIVRREQGTDEWTVIAEPTNLKTTYKDTTVENGKTYEYDVNSVLGSFVTDTFSEGQIVTYLTSPAINSVANIIEGVELKWESVDNAEYYVIYRKAVGAETEFSNYATVSTNSFIDYDVNVGKAYTYSVQAVSKYGDESAFTKTGYTITRVPTTVVTEIVPQADNIKVSWEAVDGIDGYNIYRKTENSSWEKAGGVPKGYTSFEDKDAKSGQSYYYCVAPCVGNSESAKVSSFNSVYYLKAPQNVTAINTKDAIKVSWSASAGTTEYMVYRVCGEVSAPIAIVDGGKTEFIDKNVEVDAVYNYYVKAINEAKGESKNSEATAPVKRIECVQKIKTTILPEGVMVSWREHPYADSYIVCRKTDSGNWEPIESTISFEYIDKSVVSGSVYSYSVIPVVDGFEGGVDEDSVKSFKYLSVPTVTQVTLTTNSIKISWNKVPGAKTYLVQKAPLDSNGNRNGAFFAVATVNADKTSVEDKKVKAGQGFVYRVYAVADQDKSLASAEYKSTFLATQSIKSLSNAYGGVKITWNSAAGAKNYLVYRKEEGGAWAYVARVSGSNQTYLDTGAKNGVKTHYAVKAENGNSVSTYTTKSFTYFASPKVTVSNKTSAITVSWAKISGAKSYYVYRKGPGDKSFKKVATVTKNIYTDKNVKNGKTYTYTVKAYNGKIFSGYNTTGWKIKRLSAPKLKSVKNSTSGVTFKWSKVTGASKYIVMRKVKGSSKWEEIKTTKSLSFTDKTAKAGKIYTYTVKAGYGDYRSTYIADGLKIKRLSRPSLVSVKSTKKGITFKWKEVTGASGYLVYRKTGKGKWEEIAKVSKKSTISYVDKTAKKGKTYYYSVRAYSSSYKSAYNTKGLKIKDKY